jgi:hypothetical protein
MTLLMSLDVTDDKKDTAYRNVIFIMFGVPELFPFLKMIFPFVSINLST